MRPKIDMAVLWRRALRQADLDLAALERDAAQARIRAELPGSAPPIMLDDLTGVMVGVEDLVRRIVASSMAKGEVPKPP